MRENRVAKAAGTPWWMCAAGIAAAVYLGFQVYAPSLHGPFVFDDRDQPYCLPGFSNLIWPWIGGGRPLLMFSYWLNRQMGNDPFGFHVVNVILHILNSLLVFLIVRKLLQRSDSQNRSSDLLGACAAAVFLLHPVQTESVAYIAGRSECLSVLFFLAAFAVFLYRRPAGASWAAAIAILILFAAAVASKEHTLALPAVFLLTDYYWNPGFFLAGIRRNWRIYLALALAGACGAVIVARVLARARSAGFGIQAFTWYQYFFTECRAFFVYLRLFLFPSGQNADWDFPASRNILDHGAIVALLAIVLLTGAAIYFRRRYSLASYGFLIYLLLMAPTSSFLPIQDPLAERRLYLPMLGLLMVAAAAVRGLRASPFKLAVVSGGIALVLATLTYRRNQLWANDIALWEDTVRKSPGKPRAHFQLAFAYYADGRCQEAVAQYAEMARLQKPDPHVLVDWGLACECAGDPEQAVAKLREAAALQPTAHVYSQIGLVYARQARWPEALEALAQGEKLDSTYAMIYCYRGGIRAATGNFAEAVTDYQHALALDPGNQTAQQGLAYAQRQSMPPRH
jgi:tetratricopeptide (TPR) repeat protein